MSIDCIIARIAFEIRPRDLGRWSTNEDGGSNRWRQTASVWAGDARAVSRIYRQARVCVCVRASTRVLGHTETGTRVNLSPLLGDGEKRSADTSGIPRGRMRIAAYNGSPSDPSLGAARVPRAISSCRSCRSCHPFRRIDDRRTASSPVRFPPRFS